MGTGVEVALLAASTAMSAASAAGQKKAASNQIRLKRSQQALQMAEQERAREGDLQKTLAKQNAWFAAQGTSQSSGSALSMANAAKSQMDKQAKSAEGYNALVQEGFNLQAGSSKATGNAGIANSLLDFASSKDVHAFGKSLFE